MCAVQFFFLTFVVAADEKLACLLDPSPFFFFFFSRPARVGRFCFVSSATPSKPVTMVVASSLRRVTVQLPSLATANGEASARALHLDYDPRSARVSACVWPCAQHLISLVSTGSFHQQVAARRTKSAKGGEPHLCVLPPVTDWNVVELGSGTGVVGLALAALGASSVRLTDQKTAMELLSHNCANATRSGFPGDRNATENLAASATNISTEPKRSLSCESLDWRDPPGDWASRDHNVLVLCECIYDPMHIGRSPLVPLIVSFLFSPQAQRANPAHGRLVVIAMETRDREIEASFMQQLIAALGVGANSDGSSRQSGTTSCWHVELDAEPCSPSDGNVQHSQGADASEDRDGCCYRVFAVGT